MAAVISKAEFSTLLNELRRAEVKMTEDDLICPKCITIYTRAQINGQIRKICYCDFED